MKDSILCAIDFSESSTQCLTCASKLALGADAQLVVLYSYRLLQTGKITDILAYRKKMEQEAKERFQDIQSQLLSDSRVSVSFITEIGFYSDNIENYVRKNQLTTVVLSDAMASSIYDHKGLTFHHFMKGINVPVMIVPSKSGSNGSNGVLKEKVAVH